MKVLAEVFKGIEFVRISNLPEDQKQSISFSILKHQIIKILKDKVVMHDCIQYQDYVVWYDQYVSQSVLIPLKPTHSRRLKAEISYDLALK